MDRAHRGRISSGRGQRGGPRPRVRHAGPDERRRPDPQPCADPAERARRLPHARCQGRGALRRQGEVAEEAGAGLRQARGAERPPAAHGGADPRPRGRDHGERRRGAAARMQPDQAAPAAVQHRPARRQVVPLHLRRQDHRRAAVPADRPASRRQAQGLRLFRPVRVVGRGQRDARRAAARLPDPLLPRQHLREPHPALPAVPDQALHGALRRPDRRDRLCRLVEQTRAFLAGRSDAIQDQLQAEMADAPSASNSSRRRRSATG